MPLPLEGRRGLDEAAAVLKLALEALRETSKDYEELVAEKNRRKAILDAHEKRLPELQATWEANASRTPDWIVLDAIELKTAAGSVLVKQKDGSILATGKNPSPETYTVRVDTDLMGITGIRL